jgi:hypothetical protein
MVVVIVSSPPWPQPVEPQQAGSGGGELILPRKIEPF